MAVNMASNFKASMIIVFQLTILKLFYVFQPADAFKTVANSIN